MLQASGCEAFHVREQTGKADVVAARGVDFSADASYIAAALVQNLLLHTRIDVDYVVR